MYKLSIIIPVYNRPQLLKETLESTINLKDGIEIIVIDDGSKLENAKIQKKLANKYNAKYFYQGNRGLSEARNEGIRKSKGEFLFFLDSDDLLTDNFINFLNFNKEWEKYNISRFGIKILEKKGEYKPKNNKFLTYKDRWYYAQCSTFLINKDFLIRKKLFFKGKLYEDGLWFARLLNIYPYYKMRVFNMNSIYYRMQNNDIEKLTLKVLNKQHIVDILNISRYKEKIDFLFFPFMILTNYLIPFLQNKIVYKNGEDIILLNFYKYALSKKNDLLLISGPPYKKIFKRRFKKIDKLLNETYS